MKKMIIAAAMFVSLSAFANEEKVNPKVLSSFHTEFSTVQNVEWTVRQEFYEAAFDMNGQRVSAFFNSDGDLMGITRNISSAQLPVKLQSSLKNKYNSYWITNLFEVANNDGTTYYVTLEEGDKKVVLKATAGSDWNTYKKDRKI